MAFDIDTAEFLDTDDFAVAAVYTPKNYPHPSSKSRDISVIFDAEFVETHQAEGFEPMAMAGASEVYDVTHGAMLRLTHPVTGEQQDYKIVGVEPDGRAFSQLKLELQ